VTLPNFLIIGAAKAGTTSLHRYLGQHPAVYVSPVKETNYFWYEGQRDRRPSVKTRAAYERLFAGVRTETAIGEASPQYLNSPTAPERIRRELPHARLIASLRNPADRAYSGYLEWVRKGLGTASLPEALRPGREFFEHSLYYPRLRRYLDCFPRSQLRIIVFEEFAARPGATVRDLFEYLEVDPGFVPDTSVVHNATGVPRSARLNRAVVLVRALWQFVWPVLPAFLRGRGLTARLHQTTLSPAPPLPADLRRELLERFREDIERTGELIGRDLSGWLAGRPARSGPG